MPQATARLLQVPAEALDAGAGLFERGRRCRIRDAERRADAEWRALHHRDAFGFEKLGDEVLVGGELLTGRRGLAHGAGARRIDIERAFRLRAADAVGLIEHGDAEVAPLLEDLVVLLDEVLRAIEGLDGRPL